MDFALDAAGDLALTDTGDLATAQGVDAIAQHIRVKLRLFYGECVFDLRLGFPYFQQVLVKRPDLTRIRALVRKTIETTPGIASLNELTLTHDRAARHLAVRFRATTVEGEIIDSSRYAPFVLVGGV